MMRATLTRKSQKAEARRRSSKIWSDLETLREERRQSKAAPTTKRERVLEQLRARSLAVCESSKFMTFMTVLTLYALFGDDAKLCLADSTADDAFVVAAIMCIASSASRLSCSVLPMPGTSAASTSGWTSLPLYLS